MEQMPKAIHSSWHSHLQPLFDNPKMLLIKDKLLATEPFYPPVELIFRVFEMPFDRIRVVILGQDPYPKAGQANGLAFAVNEDVPMPASLRIIRNEVFKEYKQQDDTIYLVPNKDKWKTLEHWWYQGVFLLNSALTVRQGESGSHIDNWQWFTREVIKIISLYSKIKPVWMLWGGKAKGYKGFIHGYYKWQGKIAGNEYNYLLEAAHPAAETYPDSKSKDKFTGCDHFNLCNQILKLKHQDLINW